MNVCVCVWTIWRDVKLLLVCFFFLYLAHAGGHRRPIELCPTKLSMVSLGYPGWSPYLHSFCNHFHVKVFFNLRVRRPARPSTGCRFFKPFFQTNLNFWTSIWCHFDPVRFSQSVKLGAIWLRWKGRVSLQFNLLALAMAMAAFTVFPVLSVTYSCQV